MDTKSAINTTKQSPRHSVSVAAVIPGEGGRCLLLKRRDTGAWQLPGGVLELNETIYDGLVREVEEETGLLVKPGPLTGVYKNMKIGVIALVFRCSVLGGALRPTDEASEFRWMTPDEIKGDVVEAFAVRLLDGLKIGEPAIRCHDGQKLL
jgi:8-oxo-dGTP diphosphatase